MAAVGIDLGTTYSCVAALDPNTRKVEIFKNDHDKETTPSVVSFESKLTHVGQDAVDRKLINEANTIFQVKRFMGVAFDDPHITERNWPFKIVEDTDKRALIKICPDGKEEDLRPEEISAIILKQLKLVAEKKLNRPVTKAVITIPAHFSEQQRSATMRAGELAGLDVLRVINEPTAAAIAYGSQHQDDTTTRNVLVYDLGGGTFDVSIVQISGLDSKVLATAGEPFLGGEDFDELLVNYVIDKLKKEDGINFPPSKKWQLGVACEDAKRRMSSQNLDSIDIKIPLDGPKEVKVEVQMDDFVTICQDKFSLTRVCVDEAIQKSQLTKDQLDDVVLVGGSVRIPYVERMLKEVFGGRNLRRDINPDQAVAHGAAILAASLTNEAGPQVTLSDITSLSIGVALQHDLRDNAIPAGTRLPHSTSRVYTTCFDNQEYINFRVLEGNRVLAKDNVELTKLRICVPPRPAAEVNVQVTYSINEGGSLKVSAVDGVSKKPVGIRVTSGHIDAERLKQMHFNTTRRSREDELERSRRLILTNLSNHITALKRAARKLGDKNHAKELIEFAASEERWVSQNKDTSASVLEPRIERILDRYPGQTAEVIEVIESIRHMQM